MHFQDLYLLIFEIMDVERSVRLQPHKSFQLWYT